MYDKDLQNIEHFKLHPELLPYVGSKFDEYKILLIGESHYLPEKTELTINDFEKWYCRETPKNFTDVDRKFFNTRNVVSDYLIKDKSKALTIFKYPAKVFCDQINIVNNTTLNEYEAFNYFAFYNYFQRPEIYSGGSFNGEDVEYEISKEITYEIINILKPKLIVFLSKKAYNKFKVNMKVEHPEKVKAVAHPASSWWNECKNDGTSGKSELAKYFNDFLNAKIRNKHLNN